MPERKKAITGAATGARKHSKTQTPEPFMLGPDDLRNAVHRSLTMMAEADRPALQALLLASLAEAGVNIASALLMLGIPAKSADELTPSDLGKLLRYVRINQPEAIAALGEPLAQLLSTVSAKPTLAVHRVYKAA